MLTNAELAELAAIPGPAHELERALFCELEAEHPGGHLAQAQAAGDLEWWLCWQPGTRELVVPDLCPATADGGDTVCTLPLAHPGAHSFGLAAAASPNSSTPA
ncbi:hypothetical protein I6A84_38775 [Frankia sp. CNm7]|nr:hypothetical protein [Frankia nepalensis]MBL7523832.1 hypothetical protein [Frankia nepalensis]